VCVYDEAVIDRTFILWSEESLSSALKDPVYSSSSVLIKHSGGQTNPREWTVNWLTTWQPNMQRSRLRFNKNKFALSFQTFHSSATVGSLGLFFLIKHILSLLHNTNAFLPERDVEGRIHRRKEWRLISAVLYLKNDVAICKMYVAEILRFVTHYPRTLLGLF